jgi:hypothetical protein
MPARDLIRLSIADALQAFTGQDSVKRESIRRAAKAADNIACTVAGGGYFVSKEDLASLAEFVAFMQGEMELQSFGIVPDLGKADAVVFDMNGHRLATTMEPV